ncbi:hypothetical protein [Corynebacterium sp.]|uniref:hypothetical protein n=1 Tax=Corynebacterium sp. TaxID=1720 RepID=UPI0026DD4163|nr:hypothetical protein [Corynebacterium sp.]MDO5076435.1 hypothetical protein [Corynebacterium sp.]
MLKTARTFDAAASSLFADGLAECKLSIEFMTATQAITFMHSMYFEGSLLCQLDDTRKRIFETLRDPQIDEHAIEDLLTLAHETTLIPPDTAHPLLEWAYRIVTATEPIIAETRVSGHDWPSFISKVHERVDLLDLEGLAELLNCISFSGGDY